MHIVHISSCRRYLRNNVAQKNDFESISGRRADPSRSKWETLQQHHTQSFQKDELERSGTGITTRAQVQQTSGNKKNAREYTTAKFKTTATTYCLEMMPILEII